MGAAGRTGHGVECSRPVAAVRWLSRFIARGELRPSLATLPLANIRARERTTIPLFRASRDGEE